jgi:Flp pilus assembly protein CpaB
MGKWKAFIPIVLALVIATGGSILLYKWLQVKTAPKKVVQVEETQAVPVVVAAIDLNWGAKLKKEMLTTVTKSMSWRLSLTSPGSNRSCTKFFPGRRLYA